MILSFDVPDVKFTQHSFYFAIACAQPIKRSHSGFASNFIRCYIEKASFHVNCIEARLAVDNVMRCRNFAINAGCLVHGHVDFS